MQGLLIQSDSLQGQLNIDRSDASSGRSPPLGTKNLFVPPNEVAIGIIVVSLLLPLCSCNQTPYAAEDRSTVTKQPPVAFDNVFPLENNTNTERVMDVFIDASTSPDYRSLASTIHSFSNGLPKIIDEFCVVRLTVYHFGSDGWAAEKMLSLEFPQRPALVPQKVEASDLARLKNVQEALQNHRAAQLATEEAKARKARRAEVSKILEAMNPSRLVPPDLGRQPRCTDINGVLRRVSESGSEGRPHLALLITDGAECCSTSINSIGKPKYSVGLVVVLVPERTAEARPTLKKGHRQFEVRSAEISTAIPWAVVVPHFNEDLYRTFAEAERKKPRM